MIYHRRPDWWLPEKEATSETAYINRRSWMKGAAVSGLIGMGLVACGDSATNEAKAAPPPKEEDPSAGLYPFERNPAYTLERPITPEDVNSRYNNFYEFGSHKEIYAAAQKLPIRPWEITIDGEVEKPITIGIDELMAKMPLEERLYRLRCVEAWSMTIPWGGFAMKAFVDFARPLSSANYVRMETFLNPKVASGQRASWYPWPYVEGLSMAEATNELAFLVTGAYGKPAAKQFGAPLRLAVPWKYGFKSIKSLVRFTFTKERPQTFWGKVGPSEYGFWANVNPEVPHRRWSQATERVLGTGERIPTKLFNGYAEQVGDLYKGLESEKLYM